MNLQYISDKNGITTSVIIPIQDWEELKRKYSELEKEENQMIDIPDWHKGIIDQRLAEKENNPDSMIDFDQAIDDIEKQL
ncbi:MAG: addiction module protein [Bacteroidales bacterium]|nr:addiction module protein [Bacteroidales bacterium]